MEVVTAARREILTRFFQNGPGHDAFFLAGGTALALVEFQHRRSDDLDLFSRDRNAVQVSGEQFARWGVGTGFEVDTVIPGDPLFRRFAVRNMGEAVKVDLAFESARQLGAIRVLEGIRYESRRDLLASKIGTFWSRRFVEMKDAVDLFFILRDSGEDLAGLLRDAMTKEGGFGAEEFAVALETWAPIGAALSFLRTYMIKQVSVDEMTALFRSTADRLKETLA